MIKDKYYAYRHVRLDKNEPFYIGIGTKEDKPYSFITEYRRAFAKTRRNPHWKHIINISEYIVKIIYECDNKKEVKNKEIEFIKLYGRRDLGTGTLCNLTDGGDGLNSFIWSKEAKEKLKNRKNGSGKRTEEAKRNISLGHMGQIAWNKGKPNPTAIIVKSKKTIQFTLNGIFIKEWGSATKAYLETNICLFSIVKCARGERNHAGGFVWKYKINNLL